ncbi:hypothetical protein FKW77_009055 [Venturia effusa]|uniref:Uncharacterized protein n=1 Tax=Venturia effusa TaxID=50376 RepID=A0A517L7Z8_9PEZI|nr:hypothetical protein FKW77_009055 [Venturia effusa]
MLIISYLATLFLTLAPAATYPQSPPADAPPEHDLKDQSCVHDMRSFQVECDKVARHCEAGLHPITAQYQADLDDAKAKYLKWAKNETVGGECGGYCNPIFKATPEKYTGSTYYMDCFMPRARYFISASIESWSPRIWMPFSGHKCHVHCWLKPGRTCNMKYHKCH